MRELNPLPAMRTNPMEGTVCLVAREKPEVFFPIIGFDPVNMMDDFIRLKESAELFFHNKPMLLNIPLGICSGMAWGQDIDVTKGMLFPTIPGRVLGSLVRSNMAKTHSLFHLFGDFSTRQKMGKARFPKIGQPPLHGGLHFGFCFRGMFHALARMGMALKKTLLSPSHFCLYFFGSNIGFHDMVYTMPNL
jgi:hypothetical protein